MKRAFGILLVFSLMVILTVSVFAQGMMDKTSGKGTISSTMCSSMTGMPMMQQMMMGGMGGCSYIKSGNIDIVALADKLGLSKDQQKKINGILTSHKKDIIKKNADREIAETELFEFIQQEQPDQTAIEKQIQKIANLEAEIRYSEIKSAIDTKFILTGEQWNTLKKIQKDKNAQEVEKSEIREYPG